jgi:hypothetical protein
MFSLEFTSPYFLYAKNVFFLGFVVENYVQQKCVPLIEKNEMGDVFWV